MRIVLLVLNYYVVFYSGDCEYNFRLCWGTYIVCIRDVNFYSWLVVLMKFIVVLYNKCIGINKIC